MKKGIPFLLALSILLCGCGSAAAAREAETAAPAPLSAGPVSAAETPSASGDIFAMDTYMTVLCCGERCQEALEASLAEIERIDALLSVGIEESELSRLNAAGEGTLSEETALIVEEALALWEATGGVFDITVYPLMELWGFTTGDFAVPETAALRAALAGVGSEKLRYDAATRYLSLGEAAGIDLGGIAKGYTSNRLMEIFAEYGLVSGCVSLGGNVQCYGTKIDGSLWRCGIENPFAPNSGTYLGILSLRDKAVITSGAYERFFVDEVTGEAYHHILDPSTGYSANSGLCSVTIVSADGMLADGLSTACYILGLEGAAELWRSGEAGADFDMILMTEAGEVYVTEPIAGQFTSDFPTYVIEGR